MKTEWTATKQEGADYLGQIEFQGANGDFHSFEIIKSGNRIAFGGACNAGFIESGFIEIEDGESIDCALREMLSDLETYYNDGARYVSRIVCNERM